MLKIRGVSKSYHGPGNQVSALEGVTVNVAAGEFVAVQGPSGSGKTTLLLAAGGLLVPDSGEVVVDGQELHALSPEKRARLRGTTIGFVFQQFHLIPYLSVLHNVLAPSLAAPACAAEAATARRRPVPDARLEVGHRRSRTQAARDRAEELLARFGLTDRIRHVPAELSTGERQRTALARALLNRPKLLLADEPTGNLDRENSDVVLGHLAEFARAGGAVLLVTHDAQAARRAHRHIRLVGGRASCDELRD